MIVPDASVGRSTFIRNDMGELGSCRTQLTMTSCSASSAGIGTHFWSMKARLSAGESAGSKCTIRAEWIGALTAATPRWVKMSTSWIPWALSAVTAPRAVAPNPMTAALSRRP